MTILTDVFVMLVMVVCGFALGYTYRKYQDQKRKECEDREKKENLETRQEKKAQTTRQITANRITNILLAAAKLNPTHLVNPQAKIVVHNIGCLGERTIHEIFVGWQNQYHTMGIVQVLIGDDLKIWSESVSPEAQFSTRTHPSEGEIDRFTRNVAEFVRTFNTIVNK